MIYLDNAATTFPKPESVYKAHDYALRNYGANPGRGGHSYSREAAKAIFIVREKLAEFLGANSSSQIIFSSSATEAMSTILFGSLRKGDHVVTTQLEHNAVWRPLNYLKENKGVEVSYCNHIDASYIDLNDLKNKLKQNTKLVIINHVSNVFGVEQDIEAINKVVKENSNAKLVVDGAQSAGTHKVNVNSLDIDAFIFAGHKSLYGPVGTGGFYLKKDWILEPLKIGGTGSNSENMGVPKSGPERYESGTANTPGIWALGAGIDFINEKGIENIFQHKIQLSHLLIEGLRDLEAKTYYNKNSTVTSFNIENLDSTEVAFILDDLHNIIVRAGLHCSPIAHKNFNTAKQGTIRVSPGYFNTKEEIEILLEAVKELKRG
ncbi:aminotransferase class V-fold PLP-dependent enzyme [Proteinivorax hydrogeniformans]|uniref:cysteine desulfurase n=1 Tax=Proteinivorax hydrogeniformans TaxID=1826727 RepID=A0AAU8HT34_9FIRM